ncbi:replication factor A protein [Trifolium repens]|nr:replication factor A protein [Trifolium repens]
MAKVCKRFDSIAEILPDKETVRIQVRVLKLWKVPAFPNLAETSSIEMVLVDEKVGRSMLPLGNNCCTCLSLKLRKGRSTRCLTFLCCLSHYGLTLSSLAEVCSHSHDYEFLVDVIGLMTGISPEREYVRDGKITKMVVIELTDASGKCDCALFGDYVGELNKKMGKAGEGQ